MKEENGKKTFYLYDGENILYEPEILSILIIV